MTLWSLNNRIKRRGPDKIRITENREKRREVKLWISMIAKVYRKISNFWILVMGCGSITVKLTRENMPHNRARTI